MTLEGGGPSFDDAIRADAGDLFRYAYWLARNRQQAEDIVQEALIRGWRAFPRIRDRAAVKSWLFSIVKNEFHRATAQDARHGGVDAADIDVIDDRSSPFGMEMRDALMALPASYAEPLALQVLGGFTCAEIGAMLDTTEGAVMTRLTRARQALKRLVQPAGAKEQRGERS